MVGGHHQRPFDFNRTNINEPKTFNLTEVKSTGHRNTVTSEVFNLSARWASFS